MRSEDKIRITHMIDACEEILSFLEGKKRADIETDRILVLAVIKDIEIIGEAANKISEELADSYPDIPWMEIIGMRNRLIHSYFDINLEMVWSTASHDIPNLLSLLKKISL